MWQLLKFRVRCFLQSRPAFVQRISSHVSCTFHREKSAGRQSVVEQLPNVPDTIAEILKGFDEVPNWIVPEPASLDEKRIAFTKWDRRW
jgi:hypothetical protein